MSLRYCVRARDSLWSRLWNLCRLNSVLANASISLMLGTGERAADIGGAVVGIRYESVIRFSLSLVENGRGYGFAG